MTERKWTKMTDEETIDKMIHMRLNTMAQSFRALLSQAPGDQLSFSERVAMMVDREWTDKENKRLSRLTRSARLYVSEASLENTWCDPGRGIDKPTIRELATGNWIRNKQNVIVVGKTGVGKTFMGAALAESACRLGMRALCTRVPRLLHELSVAHADGSYHDVLARLARIEVLVLDDFLIGPLKDQERRDLVEILEDRYGKSSTVITTQIPTKMWHEKLADPTMADAICDRLIHNAHILAIRGPSIREKKGMSPNQPSAT
jgi:DNA replication protein DnaC